MKLDMLDEQTRRGVFLDAENTVEGKDRSTPGACVSEAIEIDLCTDSEEVIRSDGFSGLTEVSVTVPVSVEWL